MESTKIREGFVYIVREAGDKFSFNGIDIAGRDYARGVPVQRKVVISHAAPFWFVELCRHYAGTRFKVNVRVDKLRGSQEASVVPIAESKEAAIEEFKVRYGESALQTAEQQTTQGFDDAVKIHEYIASNNELEVQEVIREGLKTRAIALHKTKKTKHVIIGGMMVGKVVTGFEPQNPKWLQAVRSFVRIHPV